MEVGIVYDPRMCAHKDPTGNHPEQPARITAIWEALESSGVVERCVRVNAREASNEELATVHTQKHISTMRSVSSKSHGKEGRLRLARRYNSIYFNEGSSTSALLAAGSVVEIAEKVSQGQMRAGVAIVRPPGHHAEADEAMGFCLFNNVAIAAHILAHGKVDKSFMKLFTMSQRSAGEKVLIVDWDVHHGNGTQHMFWNDPKVLYFSVHRYDGGMFYPGGEEGNYDRVGEGAGAGYNVNVPWGGGGGYGDGDYIAVWDHVLMPVAEAFNPDIVLISGGFDSAQGDPLGGCNITPLGYSILLQKLMHLAGGKIVLALEGGYNLESIAKSYLACVETLLGNPLKDSLADKRAYELTWSLIEQVRKELSKYWPILNQKLEISPDKIKHERKLIWIESSDEEVLVEELTTSLEESWPKKDERAVDGVTVSRDLNNDLVKLVEKITLDGFEENNFSEAEASDSKEEDRTFSSDVAELCPSYVACSMSLPPCVEKEMMTTYVWYACYGSNLWEPRFLCYIQGGKLEEANGYFPGSMDKNIPVADYWFDAPHSLFFGRNGTSTWGDGGVAFLDPVPCTGNSVTHFRAYKITLQQFNDLLAQENKILPSKNQIWVTPHHLDIVKKHSSAAPQQTLNILQGWYGSVKYFGDKDDVPILTITCSAEDVELYKKGELPVCAPSAPYREVIVKGLLQKGHMSDEEANDYISSKHL